MKTKTLKLAGFILGLQLLSGCSPDDYTYQNNDVVDLSSIDRVELVPNQLMVLANGYAELDLRPRLYTKENYLIPDERIKEEWLEYTSEDKVSIKRHFSTSDASLVGKTLTTQVKIKGTDIISEPVVFEVGAPLDKKYESEIIIPVVIHLIQTNEDIEEFYGKYEQSRLELLLQKLNNVFGGLASVNPIGTDTHIRFKFAQYDQYGKKMPEAGINRVMVKEINATDQYTNFLTDQHLVWPAEKYMNIWLISDRENQTNYFGMLISNNCLPQYVNTGVSKEDIPKGLGLKPFPEGGIYSPSVSGILYKLQELDEMDRTLGPQITNELIYYVGRYLGLYPTWAMGIAGTDYCDDTIDYFSDGNSNNMTLYKNMNHCYLRAENIMDDPTGIHCSVSRDQSIRMHWVLNNCPDRAAWKSNFAFTGK